MTTFFTAQPTLAPPTCCGTAMRIDSDTDEATCDGCGSRLCGQTGERTPPRSWRVRIRASPGALVAAEYACPVHGRFAVDVPREANGDPPSSAACPRQGMEFADQADEEFFEVHAKCGRPSSYVISAPARCKARLVEAAIRGRDQKAELPTWSDMTNIMEGQDPDEWREERERTVWAEERHRAVKEILNG
jgi:hypothetical protein